MSGMILAGCLILLLIYGYWVMTRLSDYLNSGAICKADDTEEERRDCVCPNCGYSFSASARREAAWRREGKAIPERRRDTASHRSGGRMWQALQMQ